jgi:head-tail adaptor
MRQITSVEVSNLQATQESSFMDTCTVDAYSETYDSYGDILKAWIPSSGIACGVQITGGTETIKGQVVVTNIDAKIRLSINTPITTQDRITILTRNGIAVSGISYNIENISRGVSCLVVQCTNLEL